MANGVRVRWMWQEVPQKVELLSQPFIFENEGREARKCCFDAPQRVPGRDLRMENVC